MARRRNDPPPSAEDIAPETEVADPGDDLDFLMDIGAAGRTWYVYRHKSAAEMRENPRGRPKVLVTKLVGPVDVLNVQSEFGGGVFEFLGKDPDGSLAAHRTIELDGPRKALAPEPAAPTPVAPPAPPPVTAVDPTLLALLDRMDRRMDVLEQMARVAPASPSAPSLKELAETMVMLKSLGGGEASDPSKEIVNTYFAMIQKGIDIGQTREPAAEPSGTDWGKIAETALPLLDRLLAARAQRRPVPRPAPPGAAPNQSRAEVVEPPPPPAAEDPTARRWGAAVEALARAVQAQTDPDLFADSLLVILEPVELAPLKQATAAQVMAELTPAVATYPVLGTDATRQYLELVLAALNQPAGSDAEDE